MNKRTLAAAIGAAAVLGTAALAGTAAGDTNDKTQRLVAQQTSAIELPSPNHEDITGTRFLGTDAVFRDDRQIGKTGRSCEAVGTTTDGDTTFQCTITLALHDGTLALQALPTLTETGLESFDAAVTGGTGAYRRARGTARVDQPTPTETHYQLDLR